jgi:hypothetical protein
VDLNPLLFLVVGGLVLGLGAYAGWSIGARRVRKPAALPDRLWLCDACRSFNEPEREVCYRCHRERAIDARSVVPDATFHVDQRFGQVKGGDGRGASRPWLGSDDPILDRWRSADRDGNPVAPTVAGSPSPAGPDNAQPDGAPGDT